ncbi:nucleolar protein 12 [Arthroderma uncinatum]|uniref:nucleolar protein 12 n=1 Tax=Arthroderma uncinatum TaxID=74035 RepID=UPI00144A5793|nr:nucleolar protein 12 [Arthroderma uncinatum]KAF3482108.1 nucleolar protein 12 [Arthroderma uncinatum]
MGKKAKSQSKEGVSAEGAVTTTPNVTSGAIPLVAAKVDPGLAALFAQSAGPVKAPEVKSAYGYPRDDDDDVEDDEEEDEGEDIEDDEEEEDEDVEMEDEKTSRKRKRGTDNEDLEAAYLQRLTREDLPRKDEPKRTKPDNDAGDATKEEEEEEIIPTHESLNKTTPEALDKASRTLFLSNVSTEAIRSKSAKKTLLAHLSSLLPSSSTSTSTSASSSVLHKVESLRFRSTAFSSTALPRRAAYAKKELMDSTTKSTNAYVVYSTTLAAKKALKLNGSVVLDRHLRVDSVSRPAGIDHTRCVFVGNLGFVDEETSEDDKGKKKKVVAGGDVEEGLWRTFTSQCGEGSVEGVRVVRDRLTRVGKGFAYVQFRDENGVESALLCDGKKYPPLLPRRLRVTRAKKVVVGSEGVREGVKGQMGKKGKGEEEKLFGRAVAAGMRREERRVKRKAWDAGAGAGRNANFTPLGSAKSTTASTSVVFEGYRAKDGAKPAFKMKGKKKGGKPKTRSARRASAYRAGR